MATTAPPSLLPALPPKQREIPASIRSSPLAEPLPRPSWHTIFRAAIVLVVLVWAWRGAGITVGALVEGLPDMANFVSRLFPPNPAVIPEAIGPILETVQMAIIGTLLAVVLAIPLCLLAASNVSPHPAVYHTARFVLNTGRTVPELVLALAFVAAVGLGAFPGTLALALHSTFSLSKVFAEAIEAVNPRPVEAVRGVGAGASQVITYAMIPQALPTMLSYGLLYWESNIRAATVLGLVGAGGIGFKIQISMRLFQYHDLTTYVILLILMVTVIDRVSAYLRARIT
ncbi:MAG TPA: phosphonate ABC transporter, permease protein PhnE [Chloroflexota bacterium]|nr:phosphonate ABC transporter, permease protein PhnE [Chloroflexota bacterium]